MRIGNPTDAPQSDNSLHTGVNMQYSREQMRSLSTFLTPPAQRPFWIKAAIVGGTLLLAFAVRFALAPLLDYHEPYGILLTATLVSAWYGGTWAGVVATALGGLVATYIFVSPEGSLYLAANSDRILAVVFVIRGVLVSVLCGLVHYAVAGRRKHELRSLQEFELMANHAMVLVWSTAASGEVQFVNRQWLEFTGLSQGAARENPLQAVHPDDRERVVAARDHAAHAARKPFQVEYRFRRNDGEYRWIFENAVPRHGTEGNFLGYIGSCTDITSSLRERERLTFITTLQRSLTKSLDFSEAVEALLQSVVPSQADWCSLQLLDEEGTLQTVRIHHLDPAKRNLALQIGMFADANRSAVTTRILLEGESLLVPKVSESFYADAATDRAQYDMLRSLNLVSIIAAPLRARDRVIGIFSLATAESGRTLGPDELALARKIAVISAYALENAKLYETTRKALAAEEQARRERFLTEEALDKQRIQLKTIIDAVPAMVAYVDPQERFLSHNHQFEKWTRRSYDQIHSHTLREVLGDEAYDEHATTLQSALAGNDVRFELTLKGDTLREVVVTYHPSFNARREVNGIVIHAYDITESRRLETAVIRSENRYRTLISATASIVWTTDPGGNMLEASGWQAFTGQTPEEFRGMGWLSAVHPTDRAGVHTLWQRACSHQIVWDCNYRLRHFDGQYRHIHSRGAMVRDAKGVVQEWIGTIVDVHDRVEAEQALLLKESELKLIVDAVPALVAYVHRNGTYGRTNQAYKKWFGIDPEKMRDRHLLDIVGPEAYACDEPRIERVLSGETVRFEQLMQYRHGPARWISGTYIPHMTEDFLVVGFVSLILDVSDRKRSERDLAEALNAQRHAYGELAEAREQLRHHAEHLEEQVKLRTARLQESNAELEAFSYSVSHDLRTPLRFIRGFTEAIEEEAGAQLSPMVQDYLKRILNAAQRMDTIINDLLAYSRISRAQIQIAELPLESLVNEVLVLQQAQIQQAKAAVIVESPLPFVQADRTGLFQSLSNLIANALKFTVPGRAAIIRIRAETLSDRIRLWVEDNGIGIDPKHHERIFKLFERLHPASEYPGTGIGLSLVRKAVLRMGATCGLESSPGAGSRFWIDFPLSGVPAPAESASHRETDLGDRPRARDIHLPHET